MTSRFLLIAWAAVGAVLFTMPAAAQEKSPLDRSYVAIKATLGIGGSRTVESDAVSFGGVNVSLTDSATVRRSDKLDLSYGLAAQYMVPLHRYFALGGLLGVLSWQSKNASEQASRNLGLDIAVVPQGKLPVTKTVELYVALPIGLTFNWWNEVEASASVGALASAKVEANTAVGFTVSLLAGARLALVDNFGLFTELGFTHRQFSHDVTLTAAAVGINFGGVKANANLTLDQFAWNIGVFF
jgi:hypothetical protein